MKLKNFRAILIAISVMGCITGSGVHAVSAGFYKNKVITIIIPFGPGGGYHLYSSKLAKHIKQYIPDNPPIVLQFMPGAGGLRSELF